VPPERRGFGTRSTQQWAVEAQPRIKTLGFLPQAPQPAGGHTARGPWAVMERGAPASPTPNGQQGHKGSPGQDQPPATRPLQNPRFGGDSKRADCRAPTGSTHQTQRPCRKAVGGHYGVRTPDTEALRGRHGAPGCRHTRIHGPALQPRRCP
uniref:Uncharacterized protein n=1 Tax=Cercocebus atys TaxID=9531 RepID=A0A2K5MAE2_CERAT